MNSADIVILGAGGLGREVSLLIDIINKNGIIFNKVGFYDDSVSKGSIINELPVLGKIDDLNLISDSLNVVIAIGNPLTREMISKRLFNDKLKYPNIIHPEVTVTKAGNKIGCGNIFTEGFIITCNVEIGDFNLFNTRTALGHDVKIGNFNVFNPNAQISGEVRIGNTNFFGVNSCILQGLSIGNNNMIGACSLLTRNIRNDRKYFGVPASLMK